MKKVLSVFLASLMLLGCLSICAAAAGEPGNYDSDLLALYDFEDGTFANKAPNNVTAPILEYAPDPEKKSAPKAGSIPITDGVATVSGTSYYSMFLTAANRKNVVSDNLYNKTYFAKFKGGDGTVEGSASSSLQAVFGHRSHEFSLIFISGSTKSNFRFVFSHLSKSGVVRETLDAEKIPTPVDGKWYYAALSVGDFDSVNEILPVDILLSNNGKDYAVFHYNISVDSSTLSTSFKNCYWNFGKTVHTAVSGTGMDVLFDEIAIYDRALSANELSLHTQSFSAPNADLALVAYQTTAVENSKFNMRLVGTINNVASYQKVGYAVIISNAAGTTQTIEWESTTVYSSIRATDTSGKTYEALTASGTGAEALFALRVTDIPATGTYKLTIVGTAVTNADAVVNTGSVTYNLVDGVLTPAA